MTTVRFDDIDSLKQLVSDAFGPFGEPLVVSQAMIDGFAELTGDRQWIHTDPQRAAKESPFGATVAHGYLLLSLLPSLHSGGKLAIEGQGSVINYGADKLRFVSPVPAGSSVHARRRLAHVRKKGVGGTQLTFETELWVVDGKRPAVLYRSLTLFMP